MSGVAFLKRGLPLSCLLPVPLLRLTTIGVLLLPHRPTRQKMRRYYSTSCKRRFVSDAEFQIIESVHPVEPEREMGAAWSFSAKWGRETSPCRWM